MNSRRRIRRACEEQGVSTSEDFLLAWASSGEGIALLGIYGFQAQNAYGL